MNNLQLEYYIEMQLAETDEELEYWHGVIEREEVKQQSRENSPD